MFSSSVRGPKDEILPNSANNTCPSWILITQPGSLNSRLAKSTLLLS